MPETLHALAEAHGIHAGFHDLGGVYRTAAPDTLRALLRAVGVAAGTEAEAQAALAEIEAVQRARHLPEEVILVAGTDARLPCGPCDWSVVDEAGLELASGKATDGIDLPPLPYGYLSLHARGHGWAEEALLLCRPVEGAPAVADLTGTGHALGICGALYGLRSQDNGGLGSFVDLGRACAVLGSQGARFFGINPIHALGWTAVDMLSPYSPTHRGFLNIDHIAIEGLGPTPPDGLIDYADFRKRHRMALQTAYSDFTGSTAFDGFLEARPALRDFATFEALSESHGDDFRLWPKRLQSPGKAATEAAGERAQFHAWLQWRAETQLDQAAQTARETMGLGLYLDLAVGPRPGGAEAWMNPETIARGVSIGAPPDHLNPEGQSWNLAVHAPRLLSKARYKPLREVLAGLMARAGVIRIDHALGLLRSFWQPDDGTPGGYISQPFDALLSVIAIEARRHQCIVIGEDLGLVPEGFREKMKAAGLLSYAVWQYETHDDETLIAPEDLRPFALSCFGTHDTPTALGFWYGTDIACWHAMGWQSSSEKARRLDTRSTQRDGLRHACGLGWDASPGQITRGIHRRLRDAPSQLTALQLDDLFGRIEAQNLPGTIDEHPNWRRRLPVSVEELAQRPELRDTFDETARTEMRLKGRS